MTRFNLWVALAVAAMAVLATQKSMADDCCCQCGHSNCGVRKVCRAVPTTKKIEVFCYGCDCEDVCLPGKSCRGCLHADGCCDEGACDQGGDCNCQSSHAGCHECRAKKPFCCLEWFDWSPNCAKVRTVKKLTKYVKVKEIPWWKWEVQEVCANCCPDSSCTMGADGIPVQNPTPEMQATPDAPQPPAPAVDRPISYRKAR